MKDFAIIEDEQSKKRVVPSKWLTIDLKKMKWPPYEESAKIRRAILNHENPKSDWTQFPIRFIKDKDNYNEAIEKVNLCLDEDSSDPERLKKSRKNRKRKLLPDNKDDKVKSKKTKDDDYCSVVEESDDDITDDENKEERNENDSENFDTVRALEENEKGNESDNLIDKQRDKDKEKATDEQEVSDQLNSRSNNIIASTSSATSATSAVLISSTDDKIREIHGMLLANSVGINEIRKRIANMERKIEQIENRVLTTKGGSINVTKDFEEIAQHLPLNTQEKLDDFEQKLAKKSFFHKVVMPGVWINNWIGELKKVDFMKSKGGQNAHDLVYNILAIVVTDNVAKEYSFYGRKKKEKFSKLALTSCIFFAVKTTFPKITDQEITTSIKMWLDNSGTRCNRRSGQKSVREGFVPVLPSEEEENPSD